MEELYESTRNIISLMNEGEEGEIEAAYAYLLGRVQAFAAYVNTSDFSIDRDTASKILGFSLEARTEDILQGDVEERNLSLLERK